MVELRDRSAKDGFGNDVEAYEDPVTVEDVLVQPGACTELDSTRPEGIKVSLTLHFPKSWSGDLRGARVTLFDEYADTYRVVSRPVSYQRELCPTKWNMPVEVVIVDG